MPESVGFTGTRCPFCSPPLAPRGGMKIAFLAADLCAEHLEQSGIPQFEAAHPLVNGERPCNDSCGCLSGAEADCFLADPNAYLARRRTPAAAPSTEGGATDG